MDRFHVSATGHSLNYLPHYVAEWQGYFTKAGLAVDVSVPRPWDVVLDDLEAGKADAALGGIWVPSMHYGRGVRHLPFAQLSARAPLAILGRESAAEFAISSMAGKVVMMKGSNGASVGLFVKMLMREAGLEPDRVGFVQDLDGALLSRLFAGGMGDYLVVDLPSAMAMEADGHGHVVSLLAVTGGDVPWSVYYALGESDDGRLDLHRRFAGALGRAMDWIRARPAADYRAFLAETFPNHAPDRLVAIADLYRAHGMWPTPRIDEAAHDRWQGGIAAGHLTTAPIAYHALIDARATEEFAD